MSELPEWIECAHAVEEGRANATERFIYHHEPAGEDAAREFREQLAALIQECR